MGSIVARPTGRVAALAALTLAAALVAACSGSSSTASGGPVNLHALFMKQAAYSDADVKAMTEPFTDANPNIDGHPGVREL